MNTVWPCTIGESDEDYEVEFDYSPEQAQILHPADKAQQYEPAEIEITKVIVVDGDGYNVMPHLTKGDIEDLESQVWDLYKSEKEGQE
jgi:hypothetical protein